MPKVASIVHRPYGRRSAFTLIELLVVIGIIALLIGLALAALMRARTSAKRSAIAYQLQMISTGLDAYKADFDSYPTVGGLPASLPDTGAFALCRFLLGPAPRGDSTTPPGVVVDGVEGFGFKAWDVSSNKWRAHKYGPYLQPDNFTLGYAYLNGSDPAISEPGITFAPADYAHLVIIDKSGKPILYCPASMTAKPKFSSNTVYVADFKPSGPTTNTYYFDLNNLLGDTTLSTPELTAFRKTIDPNDASPTYLNIKKMFRAIVGDADNDGYLHNGETLTVDHPYVLWSAGVDGVFGAPSGKSSNDDVTLND